MTNNKITQYIEHYIEKDKTQNAIMLSGDWGIGKSHYIQHELVPFLQTKKNVQCVVISLYGMNNVAEISKSIYLELRAKKLQSQNEITATGKMMAKTVWKGITSYLGIDLSCSEGDMQKIYESVNLSGKLIIIEDIERTQINILELLGYVNSLVEQDRIKVLLVVNEKELIEYASNDNGALSEKKTAEDSLDVDRSRIRTYTEKTQKYFAVKEKTIGDTLQFEGDFKSAVKSIILNYKDSLLSKFADESHVQDICQLLWIYKSNNLRSFIFACQKTVDIFEKLPESYDDDFIQCIFYGIIIFSLRLKLGKIMHWDGEENYSVNLGNERAPLFKFCYEYIMWQSLDIKKIPAANEAFQQKKLYDESKSNNDPDLLVLSTYYRHYEEDVKNAVQSITRRLENISDISFYDYGAIAVYLIMVKDALEFDIEEAKKRLVSNLEGRGDKLRLEHIFRIVLGEENDSAREEYEKLRKQMEDALKENMQSIPEFDYLPEQAESFYSYVSKNVNLFYKQGCFAKKLDIPRLASMFAKSSPEQKDDIRGAFVVLYRVVNIKQFVMDDYSAIDELLQEIKKQSEDELDKIQKLQYQWFIGNLTDILQRLE